MNRRLGSYELVERIGEGGMGQVWWARHHLLNRPAAIKVIRPDVSDSRNPEASSRLLRRFEREARAMSALTSPHTVQVYDFGLTDDGSFYYAMEMLDGCNLQTLVERSGALEPRRVISLLSQVCESLAEAHHNGLVHRDIKPANIFLCQVGLRRDFAKVLDFGLVKLPQAVTSGQPQLTDDDFAQGTPAFIPPEVVDGSSNFDERSDIYALGCVAYWLLTGSLVFEAGSPLEVVMAHVTKAPVAPSKRSESAIPSPLEHLVMQCLEKRPDTRPTSVQAIRQTLAECPVERPWSDRDADHWWQLYQPQSWTQTQVAAGLNTRLSPIVELQEPDTPSLIVVPFVNRSSDPDQEFFSDGISEDLIGDLARVDGLFVIGRNTSFSVKGRTIPLEQLCSRVGVRYALEGSVRRAGKRVRISARLTDSHTGDEVWAARFDRELTDIFEVQDQVTEQIVSALKLELGDRRARAPQAAGAGLAWVSESENQLSVELFWRMLDAHNQRTEEGNRMVRELAERALRENPNNAGALAMLSRVISVDFLNRWNGAGDDSLPHALEYAKQSVSLAPDEVEPNISLTLAHMWTGDHPRALSAANRALEINANCSDAFVCRGMILTFQGRFTEAIAPLEKAMRLDPAVPSIGLHYLAHCRFLLGEYDSAIDCCTRRILRQPTTDITRVLLAASYARAGRANDALRAWRDALSANPSFSLRHKLETLPFDDPGHYQKVIDALITAGVVAEP